METKIPTKLGLGPRRQLQHTAVLHRDIIRQVRIVGFDGVDIVTDEVLIGIVRLSPGG